jgi:hypothetical protein
MLAQLNSLGGRGLKAEGEKSMPDRRLFLSYSLGAFGACVAGLSRAGELPPDNGNVGAFTLVTPPGPLRGQMLDDTVVFEGIPYARPCALPAPARSTRFHSQRARSSAAGEPT